jgi:hypothetical protein
MHGLPYACPRLGCCVSLVPIGVCVTTFIDRRIAQELAVREEQVAAAVALLDDGATVPFEDYFANGKRWWVRLHEKGGKRHEMPAHHKLEAFLDDYIRTAGIVGDEKSPLFRSAARRTGTRQCTGSMPGA